MKQSTAPQALKAPFPYFGGKSRIAPLVWQRFGAVRNFVEPFAGSLAVLLARPQPFAGVETVNDMDGLLCNFWRALQHDPETVARYADWPVNENDLHARHMWLVERKEDITRRLEGDPEWYDAKAAGYWCWGICCWIGSEWCSGKGPWQIVEENGVRQLVHLGSAGRGVNRKLVHLGSAGRGVNRKLVHLGNAGRGEADQGVSRKRPLITNDAVGVANKSGLLEWMLALAERLRRVRVCCGDWTRVCGPTPTVKQGLTAVFLDPPYSAEAKRCGTIYRCEDLSVAHAVREWAIEHGDDPKLRIALCGYAGEHKMPREWECVAWKAAGGYAMQSNNKGRENKHRERLWFSPHCVKESFMGEEVAS